MLKADPVAVWRERLGFLQAEEAKTSGAGQRFELRKQIEEARAKIAELTHVPLEAQLPRIAASKLFRGSLQGPSFLVGRDTELADLDAAWRGARRENVVTLVAWGGVGKTSLVAHWAARMLARPNHGGINAYFDWSFYSQGTRRDGDLTGADKLASADLFVKAALEWFGDPEMAASNVGPWQKGERLAQLVGSERTLLILDGLEPLQDAKTGELRDDSLRSLLRGLAARNAGLCLLTTRQSLPDLATWHSTSAPQRQLARLSKEAGAELLERVGVLGTQAEREQLTEDVKGHALTLTLLGKYLAEAHGGDIRCRDLVSLSEADYEETSGHAFRVMEAYERWLERDGRRVELAMLRLLGLFDRPATPDCLAALRQEPAIPGLTDALVGLTDAQWNLAVQRLVRLGLVEEQPWEPLRIVGYSEDVGRRALEAGSRNLVYPLGEPQPLSGPPSSSIPGRSSLDSHPLIREHFARRLQEAVPEAWRAGHARLFEHLKASVPYWPEGLDGLQPLYQAVSHGCQAGRSQEACDRVYRERILRGTNGPRAFYSSKELGAVGEDLAAVACFFVERWARPSPDLVEADQAWFLNQAASRLRALGRLSEAREPTRLSLSHEVRAADRLENKALASDRWRRAAQVAANLTDLDLTLGDLATAVQEAEKGVEVADRSGDAFQSLSKRAALADVLHQVGRATEARKIFEDAEARQRRHQPQYPVLYLVQGFQYCDLLLARSERAAWKRWLQLPANDAERQSSLAACREVRARANRTLGWIGGQGFLLESALDHLTLGRAALYGYLVEMSASHDADAGRNHMDTAVQGIQAARELGFLTLGLLTRAWLGVVQRDLDAAGADLRHAQQIAERGPMPLYLADVHLHRARLFRDRAELARARALIERHGYGRRLPELHDAEEAAQSWSPAPPWTPAEPPSPSPSSTRTWRSPRSRLEPRLVTRRRWYPDCMQAKPAAGPRYTYGDYVQWTGDDRWELIDGVPFDMSPAPGRRHQAVVTDLAAQLVAQLAGGPCQVFSAPFDVRLPKGEEEDAAIETVVQPDLSVICDASKLDEAGCRGAPDWVIEVASPRTAVRDREQKRALYQQAGVREYWVVDPVARTLLALRLDGGRYDEAQEQPCTGRTASTAIRGCAIDWGRVRFG